MNLLRLHEPQRRLWPGLAKILLRYTNSPHIPLIACPLLLQKSVYGATRRQRRLLKETEEWIGSADTGWPFSFENICAALDIEADYLRTGLKRWKGTLLAQCKLQDSAVSHSPFRRVSGRRHSLSAGRSAFSRSAKAA